ncbi:Lrp/AsnC family transcriptional regulator [Calidifontibacter sp. DB0510]|uniref:Lrp/AsnC family transcriptional regulator n=1 Tax=Metallococcus carri TaxID=1656884 RepID=A0A967B905_9MICO|nr:Lrp/AsnC family transcriptional regulator [Metallococcus carri]NHN57041.1 Lrp/AsnC family transcriptional regulator [Metallococcus carri]NOP39090.1 Lrp/AsnC family transcriptional regulator [Calidifontibacter sp. DB2511S]
MPSTKRGQSSTPVGLKSTSAGRSALDETDRRILGILTVDARVSVRALAERLHLSRANAYARIDRLVQRGVIEGFGARVAPGPAGLTTTAYVAINIEQNSWRSVSAALQQLPYLDTISLLASEFDVLVQVHAPDNATLRTTVLERIQAIAGVQDTRTWLVFDEQRGAGTPWDAGAE